MPVELKFVATLDNSAFARSIKGLESTAAAGAGRMAAAFTSLASPLAALGPLIAGAFTGAAIAGGIRDVFNYTKELEDLSEQTGVGVGRLFQLGKAFSDAGLESEDAGTAINKMQRFLAEGSEGSEKVYAELHKLGTGFLDLKDLAPEQQFYTIGKAIAALKDPMKRTEAAMAIFGKSGARLLAVFNDNNFDPTGNLGSRAEILEKNAELFTAASIGLTKAGHVFQGFYIGAAAGAAKSIMPFLDAINETDLTSVGEKFGTALAIGSEALLNALSGLKDVDMVTIGKEFASFVHIAADDLRQAASAFVGLGHELTDGLKAADAFLGTGVFKKDGDQPDEQPEEKKPTPSDRIIVNGYSTALDDMTSTGILMRQRMGIGEREGVGSLGDDGGLTGPGSDTAETSRLNLKRISAEIQYQNPLLSGSMLAQAARAQEQKEQNQTRIEQYRKVFDLQHPAEAQARKAKEDAAAANKSATSSDIDRLGTRIEKSNATLVAR